jgi:pyruvate/2-oxoglutarate dehydrogenase complex dihydrolipoamide acyltransferase (E2) component
LLDLVVGSTAWKPAAFEGRIEPHEILNLTMVFDHDVIDRRKPVNRNTLPARAGRTGYET